MNIEYEVELTENGETHLNLHIEVYFDAELVYGEPTINIQGICLEGSDINLLNECPEWMQLLGKKILSEIDGDNHFEERAFEDSDIEFHGKNSNDPDGFYK